MNERLTKERQTTRRDSVWPKSWTAISKNVERAARQKWEEDNSQKGRCTSSKKYLRHSVGRRRSRLFITMCEKETGKTRSSHGAMLCPELSDSLAVHGESNALLQECGVQNSGFRTSTKVRRRGNPKTFELHQDHIAEKIQFLKRYE